MARLVLMCGLPGSGKTTRHLDVPLEELWRRLDARNQALPPGTFPIARADLHEWADVIERPGPAELELFDPPTPR